MSLRDGTDWALQSDTTAVKNVDVLTSLNFTTGIVALPLILALKRQKQVDLCEALVTPKIINYVGGLRWLRAY